MVPRRAISCLKNPRGRLSGGDRDFLFANGFGASGGREVVPRAYAAKIRAAGGVSPSGAGIQDAPSELPEDGPARPPAEECSCAPVSAIYFSHPRSRTRPVVVGA